MPGLHVPTAPLSTEQLSLLSDCARAACSDGTVVNGRAKLFTDLNFRCFNCSECTAPSGTAWGGKGSRQGSGWGVGGRVGGGGGQHTLATFYGIASHDGHLNPYPHQTERSHRTRDQMKGKAATCVGDNARLCLVSHNTRPSRPNRRIFHARTSPATKEQGVSRSTELRSCAEVERGGRPGLPVLNSPYGLRGRKATLNSNIQQRSENTWTPVEAESIQVEIDTADKRKTTIKQYAYSAYTKLVGWLVEALLYVHGNRRFIRDGSPGHPPRLSHTS